MKKESVVHLAFARWTCAVIHAVRDACRTHAWMPHMGDRRVTDPLIVSETTPDESLEPSSLLERWEGEEGNSYLSFEEFLAMTTQATQKEDQTPAEPVVTPKTVNLKNVIVLNDEPVGCIGLMYVTADHVEKQRANAEYWSERAINSLMWICIMGFNEQVPAYDRTMNMAKVAMSPEAHLFVGGWNDRDPSGMLRKQVSDKQMANVTRNVEDYHRACDELRILKGIGIEPVETHGAVYARVAENRRKSLMKNAHQASDEDIVRNAKLKEATEAAPAPW